MMNDKEVIAEYEDLIACAEEAFENGCYETARELRAYAREILRHEGLRA